MPRASTSEKDESEWTSDPIFVTEIGIAGGTVTCSLLFPRTRDILKCMSQSIYPIRLSPQDRSLFRRAARAEKKTLAEWLRTAGRERAGRVIKRRAACLDYPDWPLSKEAENDKHYLRKKFSGQV